MILTCVAHSTASCCMSSDMSAFLITALRSAILLKEDKVSNAITKVLRKEIKGIRIVKAFKTAWEMSRVVYKRKPAWLSNAKTIKSLHQQVLSCYFENNLHFKQ